MGDGGSNHGKGSSSDPAFTSLEDMTELDDQILRAYVTASANELLAHSSFSDVFKALTYEEDLISPRKRLQDKLHLTSFLMDLINEVSDDRDNDASRHFNQNLQGISSSMLPIAGQAAVQKRYFESIVYHAKRIGVGEHKDPLEIVLNQEFRDRIVACGFASECDYVAYNKLSMECSAENMQIARIKLLQEITLQIPLAYARSLKYPWYEKIAQWYQGVASQIPSAQRIAEFHQESMGFFNAKAKRIYVGRQS